MPGEYRPDLPSLLGSRLKVERAQRHLDELEPELRAYSQGEPYRIADKPDVEDEWMIVRIAEVWKYPDPRWGVRVGEFLHDLRSALDNLVWQLVLVNRKEPGDHNQFPIYTDAEKPPGSARLKQLKGVPGATRMDDMLWGVADNHSATIKELQPYLGFHVHGEQRVALTVLAALSNIDKHRFVHPAVGIRQRADAPLGEHVAGPPPREIEVTFTMGPIYPGAELFRWRVLGGTSQTKVTMEGEVPHDIAFSHQAMTLGRLDWMCERIGQIVERFAIAFPASPDEPNAAHGPSS